MNTDNTSEVARLVQRIEEESASAWRAMHGPRHVGSHAYITAKMESVCDAFDALKEQVGEPLAVQVLADTLNRQEERGC